MRTRCLARSSRLFVQEGLSDGVLFFLLHDRYYIEIFAVGFDSAPKRVTRGRKKTSLSGLFLSIASHPPLRFHPASRVHSSFLNC